MKKILFVVSLFLIPFCGFSQTTKPIDGFLGVKFGSNKLTVIAALKAKGATFDKNSSDAGNLTFRNATLAHRSVHGLIVKFVNNKACQAVFIFNPDVEAKIIEEYKDLTTDISRAYGEGQATNNYKYPYKDGEELSDTLVGLSAGKIDMSTVWFDAKKNAIGIEITTDMTIDLKYEDSKLMDEAIAKQDAKDKADL